jgi:hypothetical protein
MLAAIWFTAGMRKLVTKCVPGLVAISLMVLTLQTLAAIATGNLLIFLLLAVSLGALLAAVPFASYVPVWAVTTIAGIAAGIAASTVWLRSVTRRLGIGFRFTAAPALD